MVIENDTLKEKIIKNLKYSEYASSDSVILEFEMLLVERRLAYLEDSVLVLKERFENPILQKLIENGKLDKTKMMNFIIDLSFNTNNFITAIYSITPESEKTWLQFCGFLEREYENLINKEKIDVLEILVRAINEIDDTQLTKVAEKTSDIDKKLAEKESPNEEYIANNVELETLQSPNENEKKEKDSIDNVVDESVDETDEENLQNEQNINLSDENNVNSVQNAQDIKVADNTSDDINNKQNIDTDNNISDANLLSKQEERITDINAIQEDNKDDDVNINAIEKNLLNSKEKKIADINTIQEDNKYDNISTTEKNLHESAEEEITDVSIEQESHAAILSTEKKEENLQESPEENEDILEDANNARQENDQKNDLIDQNKVQNNINNQEKNLSEANREVVSEEKSANIVDSKQPIIDKQEHKINAQDAAQDSAEQNIENKKTTQVIKTEKQSSDDNIENEQPIINNTEKTEELSNAKQENQVISEQPAVSEVAHKIENIKNKLEDVSELQNIAKKKYIEDKIKQKISLSAKKNAANNIQDNAKQISNNQPTVNEKTSILAEKSPENIEEKISENKTENNDSKILNQEDKSLESETSNPEVQNAKTAENIQTNRQLSQDSKVDKIPEQELTPDANQTPNITQNTANQSKDVDSKDFNVDAVSEEQFKSSTSQADQAPAITQNAEKIPADNNTLDNNAQNNINQPKDIAADAKVMPINDEKLQNTTSTEIPDIAEAEQVIKDDENANQPKENAMIDEVSNEKEEKKSEELAENSQTQKTSNIVDNPESEKQAFDNVEKKINNLSNTEENSEVQSKNPKKQSVPRAAYTPESETAKQELNNDEIEEIQVDEASAIDKKLTSKEDNDDQNVNKKGFTIEDLGDDEDEYLDT